MLQTTSPLRAMQLLLTHTGNMPFFVSNSSPPPELAVYIAVPAQQGTGTQQGLRHPLGMLSASWLTAPSIPQSLNLLHSTLRWLSGYAVLDSTLSVNLLLARPVATGAEKRHHNRPKGSSLARG